MMNNTAFDFSACFNLAWETYKKNLLLLVGASLVASILMSISIGILTGPVLAGLMILILKLMDDDSSAKFEDIFGQFDTFTTTFLLCLAWGGGTIIVAGVLGVIPVIGQLATILLSLGVSVFLTFAVLLAAQKGMSFGDASRTSFEMLKKDLWPLLGFAALASILGGIGGIACGIGAVFTMPMTYLMLAAAYRACSEQVAAPSDCIPLDPVPPPAEPVAETPVEPEPPAAEPVKEPAAEPVEEPPEEPKAE